MTKLLKILSNAANRLLASTSLTLKHSWKHTLALYPSDKSRKPIFSITAKDDKSVSVVKLALILLGGIFIVVTVAMLVKRVREKLRAKKQNSAHCCCDDRLCAQIEE